jgi:hypothetical protein
MGGTLGPLAGGAATSFLGFPWAGALMGAVLLFHSLVMVVVGRGQQTCGTRDAAPNPLQIRVDDTPLLQGDVEHVGEGRVILEEG